MTGPGNLLLSFGANPRADSPDLTNGAVSAIEQFIVDTLKLLKYNGAAVFKTVDNWKWQIGADAGGIEAFGKYSPFAFVAYEPPSSEREGDYALKQVLRFAVTIGIECKTAGVARVGDATHLGASKIRDLVIAALDGSHPGDSVACDCLYYQNEAELVSSANRHAIDMFFQANFITN